MLREKHFNHQVFGEFFIRLLENLPTRGVSVSKVCNKVFSLLGRFFGDTEPERELFSTIKDKAKLHSAKLVDILSAAYTTYIPEAV